MKPIHFFSLIGVVLITLCLGVFAYWTFESDVIKVEDPETIQLDKSVYKKGERITYTITFCKRKQNPVTVYRALVDTYRITYDVIRTNLPVGCATRQVADLVVPEFIKGAGHVYYIDAENQITINPIKVQNIHWRSVNFTVE